MKPQLAVACVLLLSSAVAAAAAKPPATALTRKDDVVERLHGVDVSDPYRWLEDSDAPEVQSWTDAQNAATRRALDRVPGRAALEQRLWQLYEIGSVGVPVSRAVAPGPAAARRYFYTRRDGKQNQPVLYVRDGAGGADKPLVDVNADRADGTRALDWWFPSDDGALVAYGVSDDGSEESVLRVRDVATGRDHGDEIARTRACSLAWTPDGRGFYYTRYPAPGEVPPAEVKYHRAVFHHRLGEDPVKDRKLFGAGRDMTDWPGVDLSPDGRWLAITVSQGWSKSEVHLLDTRKAGAPTTVAVAAGEDAKFTVVEMLDDRMIVFTTSGAPRGRLYAVDPARIARVRLARDRRRDPGRVAAGGVFPRRARGCLSARRCPAPAAVHGRRRAARRYRAARAGRADGADRRARRRRDLLRRSRRSSSPTEVFRVDVAAAAAASAPWRRLAAPIDAADYEVERVMVTSRDGTRAAAVPGPPQGRSARRQAARAAHRLRRLRPSACCRRWSPSAIAVPRGGRHLRARRTCAAAASTARRGTAPACWRNKQNVFDDFIAAAEWLIANRVHHAGRLAISGRLERRPAGRRRADAAARSVPRRRLRRAAARHAPLPSLPHRRSSGSPSTASPEDPRGSSAGSPRIRPITTCATASRYPAVLLHTADVRHARRPDARAQDGGAPAGGQPRAQPVLLRLESHAGHGAGKPLGKVIAQLVDEWSFVFSQLKLKVASK